MLRYFQILKKEKPRRFFSSIKKIFWTTVEGMILIHMHSGTKQ